MRCKRIQEGEITIDHTEGPGMSDDLFRARNLADAPMGAGHERFTAPVLYCSHCQRGTIVNPLRNRDRHYCRKCDAYLCDQCALDAKLTGECRPWPKVIDIWFEAASRGRPVPIIERTPRHG